MSSPLLSRLVAVAATAALLSGCSSAPAAVPPPAPDAVVETIAGLSGVEGAADFGAGVITVGDGAMIVDSYFDPMCPYCAQFEATNLPLLEQLVDDGSITLRLHPLVFLDRFSQGSAYSTRAANALTAVGVQAPDAVLAYLSLLMQHQPAENTTGLTDAELLDLADSVAGGSLALEETIAQQPYADWLAELTQLALNADGVDSVPYVMVNGALYTGPLEDPEEFAAFVAAN